MFDLYGFAQITATLIALALVFDRPLRREVSLLILIDVLVGAFAQLRLEDFTPVRVFAAVDLAVILYIITIVKDHRHRAGGLRWVVGVSACYLGMLALHMLYYVGSIGSGFLYLSMLNGLRYGALVVVVSGPVAHAWRGIINGPGSSVPRLGLFSRAVRLLSFDRAAHK